MRGSKCISCDRQIVDRENRTLPVGKRSCEIVDSGFDGECTAEYACHTCFDVHAVAGAKGLEAHVKATQTIRSEASLALDILRGISDRIAEFL